MQFTIFLPEQSDHVKCPAIFWLSGLTCNEDNFITKAGAQRAAARNGIVLICPDTSPRELNIEGQDDSYDFGSGAGFYLNATKAPWSDNYQMYDYITKELFDLVGSSFPVDTARVSIMGHSMGGHGALICYLKNPSKYRSVSAFAPICNPMECTWGVKAFSGYLGNDMEEWRKYDACELLKDFKGEGNEILIDQGTADAFLEQNQLLPERFEEICKLKQIPLTLRMQKGYDHSYFFIASFIDDHIEHHLKYF